MSTYYTYERCNVYRGEVEIESSITLVFGRDFRQKFDRWRSHIQIIIIIMFKSNV